MSSQPYFVAESVRSGLFSGSWYDHSAGRYRLLLTNSEAPALAALVVFFIALCTKNTSIVVVRLIQLARARLERCSAHQTPQTATDNTPLLSTDARSHDALRLGYNTANGSNPEYERHRVGATVPSVPSNHHKQGPAVLVDGGRDSVMNTWLYVLERNDHWFWIFGCLFVLLGTQFLVLLLGYFANPWLLSSKAAIWHSDICGVWEFPSENTTAEEATRADVVLRHKEARAGEYAKYCYEPWSRSQPLPVYCDFFAHRNIPFEETRSYGCPFPNSSVCAGSQVVRFDTGKQPASILGINQANSYVFRKTATCVPLSVEEPYVREKETADGDKLFKYYYGREVASDDPEEPLFDTSGSPFYWTVPTYDASVFTTGPEVDGYWTPIEDLEPGHDKTLTLLFVRPLQIYYLGPSRDALFPTDHVLQFPDGDKLHIKSDPKARVLACVEETEFCEPSGGQCWPAHIRPDTSRNPGFWLMRLALKDSTIYNSIALRLGTALVAQDMVSQQLSLTLPEDHWMTEAKRLFATSLALAQIKAWSIASGEDADLEEDWEDQTPDEAKAAGGLCNLLKFNSVGYTDVDLLAFVLLLVLPWPITAMLSTRWSSINESFKPFVRQQDDTSHKRHRNADQAVVDIETTQPTGRIDDQSHSPRQQSVVSLTRAAQGPGASTTAPTLRPERLEFNAHEDDDRLVIEVVLLPVWKLLVVGITCILSFWHGMRSASSRSSRQHD